MPNWLKWFYDLTYRFSKPPWDTGVTPPELVGGIASGEIKPGRALDLGCGTGTNAIYLTQHGFQTIGVDFSSQAIQLARKKARAANVDVAFYINDVTQLAFLRGPFDLILDIGCFHSLDLESRTRYAENLVRLACPGSLYMLYAFEPRRAGWRNIGVTQQDVRRALGADFALYRLAEGRDRWGLNSAWYWFVRQA